MRISDWSSDVCSSNLIHPEQRKRVEARDLTVRPQLHAIEDDSRSRSFGGHIESAGAKAQPPTLPIIGAGAAVLDIEAADHVDGDPAGIEGAVVAADPVVLRQSADRKSTRLNSSDY